MYVDEGNIQVVDVCRNYNNGKLSNNYSYDTYLGIRTRLDLLSIPQSGGGEMSKHLVGGIKGCRNKTSSWHLNGFPDGNNIGSTV